MLARPICDELCASEPGRGQQGFCACHPGRRGDSQLRSSFGRASIQQGHTSVCSPLYDESDVAVFHTETMPTFCEGDYLDLVHVDPLGVHAGPEWIRHLLLMHHLTKSSSNLVGACSVGAT
eukprot:6467803-Amphidinium_carterae.1